MIKYIRKQICFLTQYCLAVVIPEKITLKKLSEYFNTKILFYKSRWSAFDEISNIFYKKKYPLKYWVTVVNKQVKDVIAHNSMLIFTKFLQRFGTSWYFDIQILVEQYKTIRKKTIMNLSIFTLYYTLSSTVHMWTFECFILTLYLTQLTYF